MTIAMKKDDWTTKRVITGRAKIQRNGKQRTLTTTDLVHVICTTILL